CRFVVYNVFVLIRCTFVWFQIQRGTSDPHSYKSLTDSQWRNDFYNGILPPILSETPKREVKAQEAGYATPQEDLSGADLGSVDEVSLQANRDPFKVQPATFAQARNIINADGSGLRGLNKGLKSTLGRHGVFNMIYFEFYFKVKDAITARQSPISSSNYKHTCKPMPTHHYIMIIYFFRYLALYKRLILNIMRLVPGGAVMLLVYQYISGWLNKNW
uniref:Solute carrier family 25 member 21 n=1 Tax=Salmo trutta TaxID=8032 RepID=A0A673YMB3_SALTR